jgi:MFS family permease
MSEAPVSLLRHRPFVLFWYARTLSAVAFQIQAVAVGWQIYDITGSTLDLGFVGLAQFVPTVLFMLIAGQIADRYNRTLILQLCQTVMGLAPAVLAWATAAGFIDIALILATVFVIGAGRAFEAPTLQTIVPGIVPAPLVPRAIAASASAMQAATIAGPAIGGILLTIAPTFAYAACAVLFLLASVLVGMIRTDRMPTTREPITFAVFFAGIAFIRRNPIVLGAMSLDLFAVLLGGGATALLPAFVRDIFDAGPWEFGLLRAAPAIGALTLSMVLARWTLRRRVGRVMFAGVAAFGVATIAFALSHSFALSFAALVLLGAADLVSVVIRQTLVQLETPDAMRGRVSAVNSLFVGTSNQLGQFQSGMTAGWLGTVPAVLVGGIGTLFVVLACRRLFPQLLHRDRFEPDAAPAEKIQPLSEPK